jgi:HSP20 family molecular chaperone IbpA
MSAIQTNQESPKPERSRPGRVLTPAVDILENEQELLILADLPGVAPDKIQLHIEPPEFRLEAEVGTNGEAIRYARYFRVEERLDSEHVSADFKDGVLSVHLPKASAVKPRRIAVKAS